MGRKGFVPKKKDKWEKLPPEFREKVAGATLEVLHQEIKDAAEYRVRLKEEQAKDMDLKAKKEAVKDASEVYREGTKVCDLKIAFCRQIKQDRGLAVAGDSAEEIRAKKLNADAAESHAKVNEIVADAFSKLPKGTVVTINDIGPIGQALQKTLAK